MGDGLIVQLNTLIFQELVRGFFAPIVKFLFYLIECAIDIMYELAGHRFGLESEINKFTDNFFAIFVIYMIFRLTISMLSYIVNPDSFTDKNAGFSKLIIRVIVSVALLTSINPIFNLLYYIQDDVLFGESNVIDNLILSDQEIYTYTAGDDTQDIYTTRMSDYCKEGYTAYAFTKGQLFSIMALKPFYQPTDPKTVDDIDEWEIYFKNKGKDDEKEYADEDISFNKDGYCGVNFSDFDAMITEDGDADPDLASTLYGMVDAPHSGSQYINHKIYNRQAGNWDISYDEDFMIDFRYIWAIIFGIFMLLLIITYCFDVVIRACTLFLYQIIAPVPIIAYISPNKKETDMLGNWAKKVIGCWASLFVRLAILDFVIYFAQIILSEFDNNDSGLIVQLFILFGLLMFAKKMPKLIEEVIPGLKFEGFQLNPLKRISQDAVGGNLVLGAGAAMAGAGLSGITNFGQRAIETGHNVQNAEGWRNKAAALRTGLGKTAGSTIAGATRGGINAFNRTRKDGNIIGGAWNGYQTSMFSKLQREDNLRKAGLENAGLADRLAFGAGSVGADLARYAGVLNRGQQEYLDADRQDKEISNAQADLDRRKLELNNEKRGRLEPLQQYSNYAQKIKDRISNDKTVKDAQKELEDAQASGDETAIRNARARLEMFEKTAGNRLMNTDSEVRYYVEQMNRLQLEVQQRQNITLESARKADGTFNALSIYDTQHQANVISDQYSIREKAFEADQDRINAMKQTPEYITAHDQNSQAKLQNASRTNKDIQQPGFKPSSGPIQERFTDSSLYSGRPPIPGANRGGHGGPGGPGGPAPGGPGGPQP